jgi:phage tail-like protein
MSVSSRYLEHLPATFRLNAQGEANDFFGSFLLAFERILTGKLPNEAPADPLLPGDGAIPAGIEQVLDTVARYFDPGTPTSDRATEAPAEFLDWLAGWVATSLRLDWAEDVRRRFIARVPSLYRKRGTAGCIETMLRIYLNKENDPDEVKVDDSGPTPYFFRVRFTVRGEAAELAKHDRIARAIIDQEKPAHTYYALEIVFSELQIYKDGYHPGLYQEGDRGVWVGKNTVLGTAVLGPGGSAIRGGKRQ